MPGFKEKYKMLGTIYHSSSSIVFKAYNLELNENVIIKTMNNDLYDFNSLSKLKNEYRLLHKLQGEYVVKVHELLYFDSWHFLVIEDFGAVSLLQYSQTMKLNMKEILEIAIKTAKCLEYLHKNGVIHRDINPANIVYNPDNQLLKLIDFGVSSEFSFEEMQALNPNKLEGTLAYISPEQTGRMNRPSDYRTDFYSLGVTLYQLVCGRLPFFSDDPAELVHFQIAGIPMPVHEVDVHISKAVSGIISKLMAKMPEERYRSAAGVIFDLQKCLEQLLNNVTIEEFLLGYGDFHGKFEIPKKIYGRDKEVKKLLASFQNVKLGKVESFAISGYSGIGKTSLVKELHKSIIKEQGIFLSGKYDQYNRNKPYSAYFQAVDQFCRYILSEPETIINYWKKRIMDKIGSNSRLITETVPLLELIIGEQPIIERTSLIEEQIMFKLALKNWIIAVASPEHPLVFFMDDLQWADMASLELFISIHLDPEVKGLLFIGTYRSNEVDASHPLIRSIEKVKKNFGRVEFIQLENLDLGSIKQMIADTVNCPEKEITGLAEAVYEKTLGNPFYTIEFLKHCHEDKLFYYAQDETRWKWNEAGIKNSIISENVADYLIGEIEMLPSATKELITTAACIGNHFDIKVLSAVTGKDTPSIMEELKPAIHEEMIYVTGKENNRPDELQFMFCHDKFQQAGYQALPECAHKDTHLKIAGYYEAVERLEGSDYLYIIAEHYSRGIDCLEKVQEIHRVLKIFLKAAHAAILSSAFDTARNYLDLIIGIIPEDLKADNSFLLHLFTEYHLVLYSMADYDELDKIYTKIEKIIADPVGLTNSCCLQFISLSNRGRFREACSLGIAQLEKLELKFPAERLTEEILIEIEKFYQHERNGSIENLEKMEALGDPRGQAIAQILLRISPVASFYNPLIFFWTNVVSVNLMIEKGTTADALEMSVQLILTLIYFKNNYQTGYRLAKRVMQIAREKGFYTNLARMNARFGLLVCHWFEPVERAIDYAHESYKGCLQSGEFEIACFTFHASQIAVFDSCNNLTEIKSEVDAAISFAEKTGNLHSLTAFVSFRQLVKALKGETLTFGSFNDEAFNEEKHLAETGHDLQGLCLYCIYRALSAVLFGDFPRALVLLEQAIPAIPNTPGFYSIALHNFLYSLSICKVIENMEDISERQRLYKTLEANQAWLNQRAKDAPFNFLHLYNLIDAEMKALEGKYDDSFRLYEKAILGAQENNRPYHYALACELAGQRYLQLEIKKTAGFYLKEAYSAFLDWEAIGKTEAMKEKYPHILLSGLDSTKLQLSSGTTIYNTSLDITDFSNFIDIKAVIKATQTISGEIAKDKLLASLMTIIMENSGSNRGYILLKDDNCWVLSAYRIITTAVEIIIDTQELVIECMVDKNILPISLISYVIRTKEPLIIGNILESQFSSDDFYAENAASSVMCFPILSQNILKGIVYLENHVLTEAFTKERIEVLNIFASQAAISLENSILYSELEKKVTERTKQLNETYQKYADLVNNLSVGVYRRTPGLNGVFLEANPAMVEMFEAKSKDEFMRLPITQFYADLEEAKEFNDKILQDGFVQEEEVKLITLKGKVFWASVTAIRKKSNDGQIYIDGITTDITQRKRAEEELRELALIDELTGLYNRRGFLTLATQHLKIADRLKQDLILIYADMDKIKWINDTYGHSEGDRALIDTAGILINTFRSADIISRIGGDEFVGLALDTEETVEEIIVARLSKNLEKYNLQSSRPYELSISIGVTRYDQDNPCTLDELLKRGDKLMYQDKQKKKVQREN
jgi:diguanylate cyclase (GGDEF)-like protein/PAS domain S-box-containing protein